jgi:serine/threonine-protein kinase
LSGRYRITGGIGAGGMARIYVGDDLTKNQPVAVKMLEPSSAGDKDAKARFVREAHAAMAIDHPNVIRVIDFGERGDGQPFLVMEHLAGESVGSFVHREGALRPDIAWMAIRDAARGLAAVHAAGIVHRDIKPDNLFLIGDIGAPTALKVIDFGLARIEARTRLTGAGTVLGSSYYIAPEQIVSDPVDARTDVYSLGATAYRMLTGELVFDAQGLRDLLIEHLRVEAAPLPEGPIARFGPVVAAALRKRPENRYPTMKAMLEDIERVASNDEAPRGAPLVRHPDVFEPCTDLGRASISTLLDG